MYAQDNRESTARPMAATRSRLGDALVKAAVIDELQLRSALSKQSQWGGRLAKHVVEMGFATEAAVVDALAAAFGVPKADVLLMPRDPAALARLEVELCSKGAVFPMALKEGGKVLWIAVTEPGDLELIDRVQAVAGCRVKVFVAGEQEIEAAIDREYRKRTAEAIPLSTARPPPAASPLQTAVASQAARMPTPPPFTPDTLARTPPEVLEYLKQIRERLEKTNRVLRALIEVGQAKGLFTADELRAAANANRDR